MPLCSAFLAALLAAPQVVASGEEIDYAALWRLAAPYAAYVEGADRRVDEWRSNFADARVDPPELLGRVLAAGGSWRLLVVAEDWCGDSVNTVPWIARLADQAPNLELAIVDKATGLAALEAHRTPDGRAATPTAVLLDQEWNERGCWVERPHALQSWFLEEQGTAPRDELHARRDEWYVEDGGRETLREIVERIEAAAAGRAVCPGPER